MYIFRYIIILLIFAIAIICNNSKNKKVETFGFGLAVLSLIVYVWMEFGAIIILNPIFIFIYITILFGIFAVLYKKYRNFKYQRESYKDINYLNRDISTEYPPSIVGYLFHQKLRYKDLIADIMELYVQKIITISKINEQGKTKINFYLQEKDYKNIVTSYSQIYIIQTLINDKQNVSFDFRMWKKYVLEEYKIRKFAKEQNEDKSKKILFGIIVCMTIIGGIMGWVFKGEIDFAIMTIIIGMIGGAFLGTLVGSQFANFIKNSENTNGFLSSYGESELKKWMKFKKFIQEYTLLKERSIEEIAIYESYIPYAIALDVNVQYKNTQFDIFDEKEMESIVNESDSANFLQNMGITV